MGATYYDLQDVLDDIRFVTNKDSNTLTDAHMIRIAQKYYGRIFREIVSLNEDFYTEISVADLVEDQGEYQLPVDSSSTGGGGLVKLQRVEITYDSGTNWYVADPIGYQEIGVATALDANINRVFNTTNPKYSFKDRSVWIFPIPTSSDGVAADNAGLRIFWVKRNADMDVTDDVPDMPKDFYYVLADGMLIDVYRKLGRDSEADKARQNFELGIIQIKELEQAPDQEYLPIFKHAKKNYK